VKLVAVNPPKSGIVVLAAQSRAGCTSMK